MAKQDDPKGSDVELTELARELDKVAKASEMQDPDEGAGFVDRAINKVVEVAGVAVLSSIVLLVFLNAAGRYTIGVTMIWGDEMVLGLIPWLGMLGMFLSIRRRQIIRIEYFIGLLPLATQTILNLLGNLLAAAAFVYLAIVSFEYFQFFGTDRTIYLRLQKGWFMSAMFIGPALAALAYFLMIIQDFRNRNDTRGSR